MGSTVHLYIYIPILPGVNHAIRFMVVWIEGVECVEVAAVIPVPPLPLRVARVTFARTEFVTGLNFLDSSVAAIVVFR